MMDPRHRRRWRANVALRKKARRQLFGTGSLTNSWNKARKICIYVRRKDLQRHRSIIYHNRNVYYYYYFSVTRAECRQVIYISSVNLWINHDAKVFSQKQIAGKTRRAEILFAYRSCGFFEPTSYENLKGLHVREWNTNGIWFAAMWPTIFTMLKYLKRFWGTQKIVVWVYSWGMLDRVFVSHSNSW